MAEIPDHVQVGLSSIGGSKVIQHWNIPDDKNKPKEALKTGLTLLQELAWDAVIHHPLGGVRIDPSSGTVR